MIEATSQATLLARGIKGVMGSGHRLQHSPRRAITGHAMLGNSVGNTDAEGFYSLAVIVPTAASGRTDDKNFALNFAGCQERPWTS